ncbi:hypothetical protein PMI29_03504 [Pseudomonas sp. GM49]|uniref:PD-(D/E)XK motif protein n=1 Tax=Pseudomonas sp. GM49 TaxID=1144331 RepID=UPI000270409C|nr:PD-(D/E)XK motif protein [Pseudomonas sp. GM49]EJM63031.1 hypothetical protein PMI29_03504 [Pseudomonas sp. GM49]
MHKPLERWSHLRASALGDGVIDIPTIDSGINTGFGAARYAITLNGEPRLLVPTSGRYPGRLPSTDKLSVSITSLAVAGKNVLFIDIMCLERALDPVFAELVEAILRRVENGVSPNAAVTSAIHDFQELLKAVSGPEITESAILGLVGELFILHELASINCTAIETWVGPLEQRHDFRRHVHALEVKTSRRLDATRVSIHGIDQLEPPTGGSLTLAHIKIERAEDGELSVAALVKRLHDIFVDKSTLQQRLAGIGCQNPSAPEWNRITYSSPVMTVFQVVPGFPGITRASFASGSLPSGVGDLEYSIDLTHATAYELSESERRTAFERIAG